MSNATTEHPEQHKLAVWLMVGILLLAAAAYLYQLNAISFWQDESWMAIAIDDGFRDVWTFTAEKNIHPPLYFYLAYVVKFGFGTSEFALRWLGGLTALVGVALTYRLGTDLVDRKTGLFAALLVSGSIFLVYLARIARHYTLFYTLSVAVVWVYWRWKNRPADWRWWCLLVLLQAAALYTHYFSVFIAMTIGLHAPLTLKLRDTIRLASGLILSGILFLPWLPAILLQLQSDNGDGLGYGGSGVSIILADVSARLMNASLPLGIGLSITGIVALFLNKLWRVGLLLLIWIVGTMIPVIVINEQFFQWYVGRNMLYLLPAMAILYGTGLAYLFRSRLGSVVAVIVAGSFLLYGALIYGDFWSGTPDWRGIFTRIALDARPDDIFVLDSEDPYTPDYYFRKLLDKRIDFYDMEAWTENPVLGDRIWLIDSGYDVNHEAQAVLSDTMVRTRRFAWLPIVADFWQMPPEVPAVVYGDQLALGYLGEDVIRVQPGDTLSLDVWWRAERMPDFNYSAGFQIRDENRVIAQHDGNFDSGRVDAQVLPVGLWTPDTRQLAIAADAVPGEYALYVTVYDWRDSSHSSRLPTSTDATDDVFLLARVFVEE